MTHHEDKARADIIEAARNLRQKVLWQSNESVLQIYNALFEAERRGIEIGIKRATEKAFERSARIPSQDDFHRGYACGRADAGSAIKSLLTEGEKVG